ncbi:hypothetical protein SLEP1_g40590 [Rubroshorea leprosula]|uniref:Aluminum-activated malate transporter 8-like n=1 Tax=Rubroshorea leprosula TaxID=152421 RepID=A0AAV5L465_9ROSI|nr:hypothetical protein SLEP1_g40590 [Rubroshorea leprosula]
MEENKGVFSRAWSCLKALPCDIKEKAFQVGNGIRKLGHDDPRRVIHSLKVGIALTLVSLLYYVRPMYHSFGVSGMWAVLTVVVVFEFTVGGTLSKGINRGIATILAGALGVGAKHFASLFGQKGESIVLGILVFLLAAAATFTRFLPLIKARYDYGVLIFILTFSMVAVSGYRVEEILALACERISTILIGGATCIVVSIFICPVWAGEDLHNSVASNLGKLADYLEGFGSVYFQSSEEEGTKEDKSFHQGYKSVLNSKNMSESLANFARLEPCHGRFRFCHAWKQYLKIGALAQQCAYQIEAINGYVHSDVHAPLEFQSKIQESCTRMSTESGMVLRALATAIKAMTEPSSANPHLENAKAAVEDLQTALKCVFLEASDLLAIVPAAMVASILVEIVKYVENISVAVYELSKQARFKTGEHPVSPEKPLQPLIHRATVNPVFDSESNHVVITVHETSTDFTEKEKPGQ